jgi:CubicO group peptidase (beta-lactamase class C family)
VYFPEIHIAHLLSHTAGLGMWWSPKYREIAKDSFRSVDDMLRWAYQDDNHLFEPGTRYQYSNSTGTGSRSARGGEVVGHGGGGAGNSNNIDIFPQSGWTAVVLANYTEGSFNVCTPVVQKIRELVGTRHP